MCELKRLCGMATGKTREVSSAQQDCDSFSYHPLGLAVISDVSTMNMYYLYNTNQSLFVFKEEKYGTGRTLKNGNKVS